MKKSKVPGMNRETVQQMIHARRIERRRKMLARRRSRMAK